jgi:hypothetical protein
LDGSGIWAVSARDSPLRPGGHNGHSSVSSSGSKPRLSTNFVPACPSSSIAQHVGKPSPVCQQQLNAATPATQASKPPLRQRHLDPSRGTAATPTPRGSGQRCGLCSRRRCEQRGAGDADHRRSRGRLAAGLSPRQIVRAPRSPNRKLTAGRSTADLHFLLTHTSQDAPHPLAHRALLHAPSTAHPSLRASSALLSRALAANAAQAAALRRDEHRLRDARARAQSRLLALRALERAWRGRQREQDAALREFEPPALYQRLVAAGVEQEGVCSAVEEAFLEGKDDGGAAGRVATEREVAEFVRTFREARVLAYLRRERKERWDEGRVGGWRG